MLLLLSNHPSRARWRWPSHEGPQGRWHVQRTTCRSIDHVVQRGISAGGYPGAAVVVGRRGVAVWEKGFGKLSWERGSSPVSADRTIYDLASLTKVVGTTTALMILFDEGKIALDDPVSKYVPEFAGGDKDRVTVRMLLEHRSGLPAGRDLWRLASTPGRSARGGHPDPARLRAGPLLRVLRPRRRHARLRRRSRRRRVARRVPRRSASSEPLGMTDTGFRPADSLQSASRRPKSRRRAAIRCRARCTTRTRSPSAASPVTPDSSAPRPTSPSSRR